MTNYSGATRVTTAGTVIENKVINGDLTIAAKDVVLRNSRVTGLILVSRGGDDALITGVSADGGVAVSSAHRAVIEKSDIQNKNSDDSLHVTSDGGAYINTLTVRNNWIHNPVVGGDSHYDALQVRGATNATVDCNNFDLGAWQDPYNAAVYLEDDNGGYSNAKVVNNWIQGGAFNIMLGGANDEGVILKNNKLGGDTHWDLCYVGSASALPAEQTGNTVNGASVTPCRT